MYMHTYTCIKTIGKKNGYDSEREEEGLNCRVWRVEQEDVFALYSYKRNNKIAVDATRHYYTRQIHMYYPKAAMHFTKNIFSIHYV